MRQRWKHYGGSTLTLTLTKLMRPGVHHPEEQGFKPTKGLLRSRSGPLPFPYWLIYGRKERRSARSDAESKTTVETRNSSM